MCTYHCLFILEVFLYSNTNFKSNFKFVNTQIIPFAQNALGINRLVQVKAKKMQFIWGTKINYRMAVTVNTYISGQLLPELPFSLAKI